MIRFFDVIISLLVLMLLSPFFLAIAILLLIFDGWPIFFLQNRVGKDGKLFKIVKFRTMVSKKSSHENWSIRTLNNDSRITWFGRYLRVSSIDEIPQLSNVLLGHMSLVGPRPDTPLQEHDYTPELWEKRCSVRPGLTGLAQISGRSDIDIFGRMKQDILWVENKSFYLYLKILIKTPFEMFKNTN